MSHIDAPPRDGRPIWQKILNTGKKTDADAPKRASNGRFAGRSAQKLTVAQSRAAGDRLAKKICDAANAAAVFVLPMPVAPTTNKPVAAMTPDEREAIEEPLASILARLDIVAQLDTGSDVTALLVACGVYSVRLYSQWRMVEMFGPAIGQHKPAEPNGNGSAPPIVVMPDMNEILQGFATMMGAGGGVEAITPDTLPTDQTVDNVDNV